MTQKGWIDEETFSCFVPAQRVLVKGGKKGADKKGRRWIQGIASTNARDLQGEIVNQNGIDFQYFLNHGFFNDDHKDGPEHKIGQPTEVKLTKNGLWVKGFLLDKPNADKYWDLMQELEAAGSDRKVGFSIQGKVLKKRGNVIEKCWIQDIAITTQPVNTATWAEIVKSLSTQKWDLVKDDKEEKDSKDDKEEKDSKDDKDGTEKALTSDSPMRVESLEGKVKDTVTVKSLSFDESCSYVKDKLGLEDDEAIKSIVNIAFGLFGKE